MIHVIDDWYIDVDALNYTVCKRKDCMRNGEKAVAYEPKHYFGSLKAAVKDIARLRRSEMLSEKDMTLIEAIKVIEKADNALENLLYRAIGEKEKGS